MKIEQEILINQYAQGVVDENQLMFLFGSFDNRDKRTFLNEMLYWFIIQSKPKDEDIEPAIIASNLKQTYTPCVLLKKGIEKYKLEKIIRLPDNELEKIFILLLNLFKIAYNRRFEQEKNHPDKWWYWDLADNEKVNTIISAYCLWNR
jgi:hypothetical protein